MPLAFFTRTQTGALQSRLNNDVDRRAAGGHDRRSAPCVSNVINLAVVLTIMLKLDWRLTILTLIVLPGVPLPARRLGPRMQKLTREGMQLNAEMNNLTVERFNVAGAMLAKLFGNRDEERDRFATRAAGVRDIGVRTAIYSRILFVALGLVAAVGTAVVYFVGGNLAISGTISTGTVIAFMMYVGQMYQPLAQLTNSRVDILTALVSFERVFEVLDFPAAIADRPGAVDLVEPEGRIEFDHVWFRHPPGNEVSLAVARDAGNARRRGAERVDPARRLAPRRARRDGRAGRAVGRGQDDDRDARAAHVRSRRRARCASTATT